MTQHAEEQRPLAVVIGCNRGIGLGVGTPDALDVNHPWKGQPSGVSWTLHIVAGVAAVQRAIEAGL